MKNYSWTLVGLMAVALGLVLALSCAADTATLLTACEEGKKLDLAEEASLLLLRDTCLAEWDSLKPNEDNLWKERVIHRELAMQCTRNLTRCNKAHATLTSDSVLRTDADGSSSSGKHLLQKRIEDSSLEESLEQFFEQSSQPFITPLEKDYFPERAPRAENLAFSLSYCESVLTPRPLFPPSISTPPPFNSITKQCNTFFLSLFLTYRCVPTTHGMQML